ncbi:unnamed protein product [Polarella glacialis]|uniref:J domain-containing protein n=1 Tax=Polarella glacialis TaxID=89957 RepID=A0A813IPW9_POLGL|nr:unnamed protein product [Polarella glacialis]CAE8654153.1 unnamed protein product [Polarella glacialis]
MDGSGSEDDGLEFNFNSSEDIMSACVGIIHCIATVALCCMCRKLCRRFTGGKPAVAAEIELEVSPDCLQPRKRVLTSYLLWLGGISIVPAHHFYLERLVHGLIATWTLNFCGIGWVLDFFLMPFYVRGFNRRRAAPTAAYDGSRRQLLCRLPAFLLVVVSLLLYTVVYLPYWLHVLKVVDIDRIAAQTEVNPYDTLGIAGSASLHEAKSAYRTLSLKWHPDRNAGCGKSCDDKMSEITKAFNLVKMRRAPPPADRSWEGWLQDVGKDWFYLFEVFKESKPQDRPKSDL